MVGRVPGQLAHPVILSKSHFVEGATRIKSTEEFFARNTQDSVHLQTLVPKIEKRGFRLGIVLPKGLQRTDVFVVDL